MPGVPGSGVTTEQVVQVDKAEGQATQYLIHEALEGLRGVAKAKWHSNEFEEAKWCDDCGLGDVVRVHGDLMIRPDEVNLRKDGAVRELRSEVLNVGDGVAVRDGCGVECAIVTAISLPIKLYVALQVGVAVILSQRPTLGTLEYSTNRFCGETYVLAGVLKSQVFKLCFGAKSFVLGKKIGKVTKRRRSVKPTCANGGTNRANGGTNASFCTSGDFPFFLACGQICFEFESATVKLEKKEKERRKRKTVAI